MGVEKIIGLGQTDKAFTDGQTPGGQILAPADGMPVTVEMEHARPGMEAGGHERTVVTKQVAPEERGFPQQIDFGHDEITKRQRIVADDFVPDEATQWAFTGSQRHPSLALRAFFLRGFALKFPPLQVDGLFQGAVHQRGGAKIQDQAVFLDDAGKLLRIHHAQPPADHLNEGRHMGTGAQQHHATGRRVVIALGQDRDIDHHLDVALLVLPQARFALAVG